MNDLELSDIQGIVARGYGALPAASYLLATVQDSGAARSWLGEIVEEVTRATERPTDRALHVALTSDGLRMLGLSEDEVQTFSREFAEGLADANRASFLGDVGESAPDKWRWGGPTNPVHILLLLFARDDAELGVFSAEVRSGLRGISVSMELDTFAFDSPLEHFGFADGIAQPFVKGFSRSGPSENTLAPGEFILGYANEYDKLPVSPFVSVQRDATNILPRRELDDARQVADLGRNGTYLVFRQLSQDVQSFWEFVSEASMKLYGSSDHDKRVRVGAKMVGRWPSGAPITICPDEDDLAQATTDTFGYRQKDMLGQMCPRGAHIRRANPRDALEGSPEDSIKVSNRHRILRRGRPYGAPVSRSIDVDEILEAEGDKEEVGLHFIGLNTDIARQFEFIQHTWIVNPKFDGLYSDSDPLMGNHDGKNGTFTMQAVPVRKRITGMKRFVEVRGGAYFFLPSIRALQFLATT
jgi:Dyp-type peroxidase family